MNPERRLNARRILYSPEYLDMGADNGGVVVNLSEGGLGFHAVGPVIPDIEIPVSFSLGPGYRIDVKARVVWVGEQGKIGGAVFGKLSKDSRSLIREWLAKPEMENEAENAFLAEETENQTGQPAARNAAAPTAMPEPAMADQELQENAPREGSRASFSAEHGSAEEDAVLLPHPDSQPRAASHPARETAYPRAPVNPAPVPEPVATPPVMQNAQESALRQHAPVAGPDLAAGAPRQPEMPRAPARPEARPTAASEPEQQQPTAASFSAVPSISAWNKGPASPGRRTIPPPTPAGPVFPPRNVDNIFARSPSGSEFESGRRRGSVLMVLAVIIAAGAIVAYYARGHRQQIGNALVHMGNSVAGTSPANATEPAPAPANASPAPGAPPSSGAAPAENHTPPSTAGQAAPSTPTPGTAAPPSSPPPSTTPASAPAVRAVPAKNRTEPAPTPTKRAEGPSVTSKSASSAGTPGAAGPYSGQAEYQRAENYLNGKGVDKDPAEAAEWFWRSLEAGNTTAAIPLADLYLQGNGVSRSCTQARILLDAAAQKDNPEAIRKLQQLPESCH